MYPLLLRTGKSKCTQLRHTCVIICTGSPCLLDTLTCCRNRGSWFTRVDSHTYARLEKIDTMFLCHFRQTQGIAGRTHKNSSSNLLDHTKSLQRIHAPTRYGERSQPLSSL